MEVLEHAMRGAELSEAIENIVSNRITSVVGTLRLSAPPSLSDTLVAPLVTAFQASYPNVRIHILITERHVDHIVEGVDLVFRRRGLKDSSLVVRKLLHYRHQLVASPDYLKSCKPPQRPHDLLEHRLLTFSYWRPESSWSFAHVNGVDKESVTFEPSLAMNDFAGLVPALLAGAGIGELPPVVRRDLVRQGQLIEVMPDWHLPTLEFSLVHLGNRHISKPCRLFKEFATQMVPKLFPDLPA
jgi:DNA-binding transcriptional LysR family regulator